MAVATYLEPNFTIQDAASYKTSIDGAFSVHHRLGGVFAPHEQAVPDLTVAFDAGMIYSGIVLTEVASQSTGAITAPVTDFRIDRVVADGTTGIVSVITGVENASPVAPVITENSIPLCQIALATSTTAITNFLITDERPIMLTSSGGGDFTTGDVKLTYKTVADDGFVLADDGSIGSVASGASNRANSDTLNLFTLLYDNMSDAECSVSGGRGANAVADFAADKNLTIPLTLGRALAIAGVGSGLTSRILGSTLGEEDHIQLESELDAHTHGYVDNGFYGAFGVGSDNQIYRLPADTNRTTTNTGGSIAFNIMQPTSFINIMIKL